MATTMETAGTAARRGDRRPGDREAAPPHGKKRICDIDVQQGACDVPRGG